MLSQLCTRRTCDSNGPVLLQASAGGGRLVSSCRSSNAGHVRPPATPPIWAEWAGAKTQTFEQHTGCTWQSMLAICHSVHTCTPRQKIWPRKRRTVLQSVAICLKKHIALHRNLCLVGFRCFYTRFAEPSTDQAVGSRCFGCTHSSEPHKGSHRSKPNGSHRSKRHWAHTDLEHTRSTRRKSATHQERAGGQTSAASPENTAVPGT